MIDALWCYVLDNRLLGMLTYYYKDSSYIAVRKKAQDPSIHACMYRVSSAFAQVKSYIAIIAIATLRLDNTPFTAGCSRFTGCN